MHRLFPFSATERTPNTGVAALVMINAAIIYIYTAAILLAVRVVLS